jgi:gamma-glutamyltranspeptidase/glutathione hydrolase
MIPGPRATGLPVALTAWLGLGLQLFLSIRLSYRSEAPSLASALIVYLGYFTILTNLFVALVTTAELFDARWLGSSPLARRSVAGCAAASIAFVGVSYHLLLRNIWAPQGLQRLADIDLHYAVPLLAVLHWAASPGPRLPARSPVIWCVYPAAYFAYALIRGVWVGSYPYPFIDVSALGYARVGINGVLLLVGFVIMGYVIWGIGRARAGARGSRGTLTTCLTIGLALFARVGGAQTTAATTCDTSPRAPFCSAVRGVRAEGWSAQSRSEVLASNGMVVTSQPLAAQAGLRILMQGGNAVDAAVAAASTLSVVEPMMVGVASDLFAMVYVAKEHKVYVLNASGTAPSGATLERFNRLGYRWDPSNWGPSSGMPIGGILPVTVPGGVLGWQALEQRFGKLSFKEVLEPAVQYAEGGFPISERIASDWVLPKALPLEGCCTQLDPDSVKTWYSTGRPPSAGDWFKNPDLARTLRLLQEHGADEFYRGKIAEAIVAKSNKLGGTMTLADLAGYRGEWVEPARSHYRGQEILELPPPSQAWAAEEILNILAACVPRWAPGKTLASLGPSNAQYWHLFIEAKKLAFDDLLKYNADPDFVAVPLHELLSESHAASLCGRIDPNHASTPGPPGNAKMPGDTVVLSTADREGNMVSWVNSNYYEFGSGVTVPGYGFVLHNRGGLFTLDPRSPNVIAPHKRPFNTLSAGFVLHDDGTPLMTVTLMGGDMQAQGHAQLLVDVLDLHANVQAAADMARFWHSQVSNELDLEAPLYDLVGTQLSAMGHKVKSVNGGDMGGVQVIESDHGFYRSGSDPRKDGEAAGW